MTSCVAHPADSACHAIPLPGVGPIVGDPGALSAKPRRLRFLPRFRAKSGTESAAGPVSAIAASIGVAPPPSELPRSVQRMAAEARQLSAALREDRGESLEEALRAMRAAQPPEQQLQRLLGGRR